MIDRTTAPALSSFGDLSLKFPDTVKLKNGIPCYVIDGGDDEMNYVSIFLSAGSLQEEKPALATLTSMMITEGNESMPSREVAEKFDFYGARKSAVSYEDCTEITMRSLNENFRQTMTLLTQCIMHPSFPSDEVETFKRKLSSNISMMQERVSYIAYMNMRKHYFGADTKSGHITTPEDIMAITRDDLLAFHKQHFTAAGCSVVVAGRIDEQVMDVLNNTIGQWECDTPAAPKPILEKNPTSTMLEIVDKPGALQSAVMMQIETVKRTHEDYLPLRFLIKLWGGYFGSRLMMNIREEKGYTYGIYSALQANLYDASIVVGCECATQHTWNVVKEVKREMQRLREELVPEHELSTVRQHMLSAAAKVHDTPIDIARYVASTFSSGIYPEYHNEQLKVINSITPERLKELACRYLDESQLRIVIAGDKAQLEKIMK